MSNNVKTILNDLEARNSGEPEFLQAAREVLSLPVYPELTEAQLVEVASAVRAFYGR